MEQYLQAPRQRRSTLLIGPPGSGKTSWARQRATTVRRTESQHVAWDEIYRLVYYEHPERARVEGLPFRAPHHSVSELGMTGKLSGGYRVRPGEASLAHGGVLFVDEAFEFRRQVFEAAWSAYELGRVTLIESRHAAGGIPTECRVVVPAEFDLVLAVNPCPGGCLQGCTCRAEFVGRWRDRLGALSARVDTVLHARGGGVFEQEARK